MAGNVMGQSLWIYLVGGLVAIFYFPINIGFLIIPIDVHIFQRGSKHQPVTIYLPVLNAGNGAMIHNNY